MDNSEGLSPRVRGNPPLLLLLTLLGSIPACAGEPTTSATRPTGARVYPRVCGGTDLLFEVELADEGLSPRVRGNHRQVVLRDTGEGSIPACAGEPSFIRSRFNRERVYPRVCGGTAAFVPEHYRDEVYPRVCGGTPRRAGRRAIRPRSIPACAGEPGLAGRTASAGRVYPRVCGGTALARNAIKPIMGLSPRVRGNQHHFGAVEHHRGSIPACAGEPGPGVDPSGTQKVYPRVCGGTLDELAHYTHVRGLSPRVRGNLRGASAGPAPLGSIPACAGEPVIGRLQAHDPGSIPACAGEPRRPAPGGLFNRVYPRVCGGTPCSPSFPFQ